MQRLGVAVAAIALFALHGASVVEAQGVSKAVDPGSGVHAIDEPVAAAPLAGKTGSEDSKDTIVISAGETRDALQVKGKSVIVRGTIRHDVDVEDGTITIEPGGKVEGAIRGKNITVNNESGHGVTTDATGNVTVNNVNASGDGANGADGGNGADGANGVNGSDEVKSESDQPGSIAISTGTHSAAMSAPVIRYSTRVRTKRTWADGQFALMLLGLIGAALAVIVTPVASRRVAEHVSQQPRRDLAVGIAAGVVLLSLILANAVLLKLPLIRLLWAPIGIIVAFAPLLLLGFGWLSSMRTMGDYLARKMGSRSEGSHFGRIALGLFSFFVLNAILGSINPGLGIMCLGVEIAMALAGVGATAVILTGSGFRR